MHTSSFDDLIPHMKRAGFTATTLAATITAMFGYELGENLIASLALAGLMALCTYIVGYSLVAAHAAYKRNMKGVAFAATALFAVAVTCEFIAHTGFNAANRDATVQKANLQTIGFTDSRNAVTDAEAKLARLRSDRAQLEPIEGVANIKPWRDPASARAAVQTAEVHRFFTKVTEGCTKTFGPQTRKFCSDYEMAKAEVERWELIAAKEIEIGAAELAVTDARKAASVQTTGHASGASQNLVLASMFTANVNPDETAAYWSGVGISALLAIFAIAAGGLCNFVAFAFESATKPVRRAMTEVQAHLEDSYAHIYQVQDETAKKLAELLRSIRPELARAA